MIKIILNGEDSCVDHGTTISELLRQMEIPAAGTAVAIGDTVVSRDEHDTHELNDGERIEVIRAIGGG